VHGFRCYDNIQVCKLIALYNVNAYSAEREMSASICLYSFYAWFICYVNLCMYVFATTLEVNKVVYISDGWMDRIACLVPTPSHSQHWRHFHPTSNYLHAAEAETGEYERTETGDMGLPARAISGACV